MTGPETVTATTGPPEGFEIRLVPDNFQHVGSRKEQQDAFYFSDLDDGRLVERAGVLAIVADGMGGLQGGRQSSRLACQTFREAYEAKDANEPIPEALWRALRAANEAVGRQARRSGLQGETGTTLVAAVVAGRDLHWISAGDSRLYLHRGDALTRVTIDHDYARELDRDVARGRLSREDAEVDPQRTALASYLGAGPVPHVDRSVRPLTLQPGDRLLLCSDGLYDALGDDEISDTLAAAPPGGAAERLMNRVLEKNRPRQDNLTGALLDLDVARTAVATAPVSGSSTVAGLPRSLVVVAGITVLALVGAALYRPGILPALPWLSGGDARGVDGGGEPTLVDSLLADTAAPARDTVSARDATTADTAMVAPPGDTAADALAPGHADTVESPDSSPPGLAPVSPDTLRPDTSAIPDTSGTTRDQATRSSSDASEER